MKRTALILAAVATAASTSCGAATDSAATAPAASSSMQATTESTSDPDAFWADVRDDETAALVGRKDAVKLGEQICEASEDGTMDRAESINAGIRSGFGAVEAAHMVDAALEHLCPS